MFDCGEPPLSNVLLIEPLFLPVLYPLAFSLLRALSRFGSVWPFGDSVHSTPARSDAAWLRRPFKFRELGFPAHLSCIRMCEYERQSSYQCSVTSRLRRTCNGLHQALPQTAVLMSSLRSPGWSQAAWHQQSPRKAFRQPCGPGALPNSIFSPTVHTACKIADMNRASLLARCIQSRAVLWSRRPAAAPDGCTPSLVVLHSAAPLDADTTSVPALYHPAPQAAATVVASAS